MTESSDVTLTRLEEQLRWYDNKAQWCKKMYNWLKAATFVAGGLIPLSALWAGGARVLAVCLGFIVVICESFQQLGQFQQNWLSYRGTAEALKHEKYLYHAPAGAYADAADPHRLLAEQIESIVSQEHARWSSTQDATRKNKGAPKNGAPVE
jgi:Protein of unknown function (DUF4231)